MSLLENPLEAGLCIEILQIESTSQTETCQHGRERERERVIRRVRLSLYNAVRVDKDGKNLPSSLSFALIEFPDCRCHLQRGLWLVNSICNISMGLCGYAQYMVYYLVKYCKNQVNYLSYTENEIYLIQEQKG